MLSGCPYTCGRCAFSANTGFSAETRFRYRKPILAICDSTQGLKSKKEKRPERGRSSPDELVGGKLILLVYCRPISKSFQFILSTLEVRQTSFLRAQIHGVWAGIRRLDQSLGDRAPASPSHLGVQRECALRKVERDDLSASHVQGVELVGGAPGEFAHMEARTFESDYASPPKRRPIGEFLKQVVFVIHRSPFLATLLTLPIS